MNVVTTTTAITSQPTATRNGNPSHQVSWIAQADVIECCPPGLEYLSSVDQLLVKQNVEVFEMFTGVETANKYVVINSVGQKVYYAIEDTDWCTRACCGPGRPFDIRILDNTGNEVIHLNRPFKCPFYCFPCCQQELEVSAPPGQLIGRIVQKGSFCAPAHFQVLNSEGQTHFRIQGPCCQCNCCEEVEYQVLCKNAINELGTIRKQWTGFLKETLTDADNFGITFPLEIDITMKATLLGALFLIDFMFFEKPSGA